MRLPRRVQIFKGQMDAAPFAGVFFLLVIFLLLNSSLVFPPGLKLQLPEAEELPGTSGATITVAIDASGLYFYQHQVIAEKQLRARLATEVKQSGEPLTLVVRADKSVSLETIIRLNRLARSAGIHEAVLTTRPPLLPVTSSTSAVP
ncbi:MAG: biopolymer transporter ExbD [Verrucomicrobiota bacterium]